MSANARAGAGTPGASPPSRQMGTWATWGRRRRRLVVLLVTGWAALGVLAVIAILRWDARVLPLCAAMLALGGWTSGRLRQVEYADGALDGIDDEQLADDEQPDDERELLTELDASGSERGADFVLVGRWLSGDPVLRRYEYPTRELLVLRTAVETIEMLGLAIIVLTAPAVAGIAIGFVLVLLGGRAGAAVGRSALGDRLYRTPVDDQTRKRWLSREQTVIIVVGAIVLAVAAVRWLT